MTEKILKNKTLDRAIKILPVIFLFLGLVLLFGEEGWWPAFYTPIFFGVVSLISAALIFLPQHLFRRSDECKKESAKFLTLVLAAALTANLLGELYFYRLYQYGFQYDKFIHLANTFLFTLALTFIGQRWRGFSLKKSLTLAVTVVIIGGLLWEANEYFSDLLFKTSEFGIYGQFKTMDTLFDLSFDVLGAVMAAILLASPALDNLLTKIFSQACGLSLSDKSKNL